MGNSKDLKLVEKLLTGGISVIQRDKKFNEEQKQELITIFKRAVEITKEVY